MAIIIIILIVLGFIYFSDSSKYTERKREMEDRIARIERKMKISPEYNAVHYYNLAVAWQERFAFDTARQYFKKAQSLLLSGNSSLSNNDQNALLNLIESGLEFCGTKMDKTDSSSYYSYSDRFAAGRAVGWFRKEWYQ